MCLFHSLRLLSGNLIISWIPHSDLKSSFRTLSNLDFPNHHSQHFISTVLSACLVQVVTAASPCILKLQKCIFSMNIEAAFVCGRIYIYSSKFSNFRSPMYVSCCSFESEAVKSRKIVTSIYAYVQGQRKHANMSIESTSNEYEENVYRNINQECLVFQVHLFLK